MLAISVTHADGRVTRWGPDEPGSIDIPADLTFSTSIPGGFKDLQCSLLRRIDISYADEALFDSIRVYGPGNRTVWEGLVQQLPKSHGDSFGTTPGAVGWSAALTWDPSFREVYVDRDMSHWTEATLLRRRAMAAGGFPVGQIPVTIGGGGVSWTPPNTALPANERTEIMYDIGPGLEITRIEYRGQQTGTFTNFEAPAIYTSATESLTSPSSEALTLDDVLRGATSFTDNRYAMLRAAVTTATTPAAGLEQSYDILAVYSSVVTSAAWAVAGDDGVRGVLASGVIADILSRTAPILDPSGIEDTDYAIPHLVFQDPTTAADAIALINGYHAYDWGVYENKVFFFRQPDPAALTWEARLSDGAHLDLEGDTAEQIFNGVYVVYQDGTGKTRTVGPSGATADDTDAALEDTSDENPINAHDLGRRWGLLQLSVPTNLQGATTLGVVWLAQHSLPQRRGTLTLTGTVAHPTRGKVPVWEVRAGDYIRISDHSNDVARKVIETSYSYGTDTITCTLDNTAPKLEALLERLGAGIIGRL